MCPLFQVYTLYWRFYHILFSKCRTEKCVIRIPLVPETVVPIQTLSRGSVLTKTLYFPGICQHTHTLTHTPKSFYTALFGTLCLSV